MRLCALFLGLMVLGCGDDEREERDSGLPPADTGPEMCTIVDTVCPAELPFTSAACDLTDMCMYPDPDGMTTWTYRCESGMWRGEHDCMTFGGGCPVGPLAEGCRMPFAGTLAGATVEIGPQGTTPFRPLMAGETIVPVVGGQGSPMFAYRVRVSGDGVPRCIGVTTTATIDGVAQTPSMRRVTLHCGESLTVFEILAGDFCRPGPFALTVHVQVDGIGETSVDLTFDEVACTG
jgi:hypothetical protein